MMDNSLPRAARAKLDTKGSEQRFTYTYTPYGSVTAEGDVTQPIQWSSEVYDPELALNYYNYRYYNPTDGRWTRRDMLGNSGGMNLYAYVNNNVYSFGDYLGNLLSPYSGPPEEKEGETTDKAGVLASTTTAFPPIEISISIKRQNNVTKYCLTLQDTTYKPVITYYSYLRVDDQLKPNNGYPDYIPSGFSRSVREHEMEHVRYTSMYWDDFVSVSNGYEGCYCTQACRDSALEIVSKMYRLYEYKAILLNASFDLAEYGFQLGGETQSDLVALQTKAQKEIQDNNERINELKRKMATCKKI